MIDHRMSKKVPAGCNVFGYVSVLSLGIGLFLFPAAWLAFAASCYAKPSTPQTRPPVRVPRARPPVPEEPKPAETPKPGTPDDEAALPGDWAPALLYRMISSPNEDARNALLNAAFAAGSSIVPQLEAALKDDRTAEFAAQALAYLGGPKAFELLTSLVSDPRDLDLRRFYYGALAEFQVPQASDLLLNAINRADAEPDRTVTEAAILALTVRSDAGLLPALRQAESNTQDPVIRGDLDNAMDVIRERARYLASPRGRNLEGSLQQAVRTYFMPALEEAGIEPPTRPAAAKSTSDKVPDRTLPGHASHTRDTNRRPAGQTGVPPRHEQKPAFKVEIRSLTFSPDKNRALARVSFEDSSAVAYYDMVLQRRAGNWELASVWLGPEVEKPSAITSSRRAPKTN